MRPYQEHILQISEYFVVQANYEYQSIYSIKDKVYKVQH